MNGDRHGGVVAITGASAGVGRATAAAFAQRGMSVALLARGRAGLKAAAADVEAAGGRALVCPVDVGDADAVDATAERIEQELGEIDIWVNNAMTTVFAPTWEVELAEFRRATEVTYLGLVHGTMAALARMRPRDRGVIVNVGSALAYRAIPLQAAYCGAKFATRGFTEALRTELLHERSGVRVTMVHLPAVNTPQFGWCLSRLPEHPQPVPPVYAPAAAASAIVRAGFRPRRSKVLGGYNTFLVVANKVAPGVVDHLVARTGVAAQQTDQHVATDRPFNLWDPVDDDHDAGDRGVFGAQEGGMRTMQFWRSVPRQIADVTIAASNRLVEVATTARAAPVSDGRADGTARRRRRRHRWL